MERLETIRTVRAALGTVLAISAVVLLMPIAASAQADRRDDSGSVAPASAAARPPQGVATEAANAAAFQARPAAAPPRDADSPRRRGSMVGYIEDAVISSKVRIRFDAASDDNAPDRAEFFYAKCGCYRDLPHGNDALDFDAPGPGPGVVTSINFQQVYIQGEYAVRDNLSLFGELPVRWLKPQSFVDGTGSFSNQRGLSDLRAGAKLAISSSDDRAVTAKVQLFLPTGDALRGLGTNHASVEPSFLYYQQVSPKVSVESEAGVWIPLSGSHPNPTDTDGHFAGNVLFYGIGPSFDAYHSGSVRVAPVVELVGWRLLSGNQTLVGGGPDATGTNILNIKFGARASWDAGGSIYFGYGKALTDARWYDDIVRIEYRYSF